MTTRLLPLALTLAFALAPASAAAEDAAQDARPAPAATDHADVLVLKDGRRLVGELVAEGDGVVTFRAGGATRAYSREQIESLEKSAVAVPPPPASDRPVSDRAPDKTDKAAKKAAKRATKEAKLTDSARAWLDVLIETSADADPQVQQSLAAAMKALGAGAVAPLREAAARSDGGTRLFLERVARSMEESAKQRAAKGRRADNPLMRARRMREALAEELSIGDDQRAAFNAALDAAQKRQMEIGRAVRMGDLEREAAREQFAGVRADLNRDMKAVLDEAQYVLFEEISREHFAKLAKQAYGKKKKDKQTP